MNKIENIVDRQDISNLLLDHDAPQRTQPIWLVTPGSQSEVLGRLSKEQRAWLHATGFNPKAGRCTILPGPDGHVSGIVFGLGAPGSVDRTPLLTGSLPERIPNGYYHFETLPDDAELAVAAWLMGAYKFSRYSQNHAKRPRWIRLPEGVDRASVLRIANSICMGRDLINMPANDLGPAELAEAAADIAQAHGASVTSIVGEALMEQNFPMIHAVGRASDRAPRLIDLTWGQADHPKVSVVGKGICFDTGGLNIKPGNAMALMKKDMGGAAAALTLANMVMDAKLPVRLRVLVPAADNNISANAFRPGDILPSRKGLSVEIGNTDAEGRLVLADALAYADEEAPDLMINFATLTGAARVALGPDLPPFYTANNELAKDIMDSASEVYDPLWHMPFWRPYDKHLASKVADISHISESHFAGSITAALFLARFVRQAKDFVHLDIYGWVPASKPAQPRGGEPQGARAMFNLLQRRYGQGAGA